MKLSAIKRSALAVSIGILMSLSAHQASAVSMDDMVNEYTSSVVGPNANLSFDGRRGYISGGSLRVRFQNKEAPELYRITLPSFKADCNGMDMNLGSLSWISASEFMDAARAMASPQVLIYALSLALNQMCGPCAQKMEDLQDKLNQYNDRLKMSCEEIGTALYEKSGAKEKAQQLHNDWWGDASNDTGDDAAETEGNVVQTMLDNGKADVISGNIVWEHLKQITVKGWLQAIMGEHVAKEMIMTMTGTSIVDATSAGGNEENIERRIVAPRPITLLEIINGEKLVGISCNSDYVSCLGASRGEIADLEPMGKKFFEYLSSGNPNSIITKFTTHYDGISLSSDQEAFMIAAQQHIDLQKHMHTMAKTGNTIPDRVAAFMADWLAIEIALHFMTEYVDTASEAVASIDNKDEIIDFNPFFLKQFYQNEAEMLRAELAEKLAADADLASIVNSIFNN